MVRRIVDFVLSIILVLLFFPLSIPIAIAIKIEDGGKIIYASKRVGFGGKSFRMLKFRTMTFKNIRLSNEQLSELQNNFKLKNDPRITKVGHFLRVYCIDEIPQFLNILTGDMAIIGPRPKLPEEIYLYGGNKNELLSVLPGITGYWQVFRKSPHSDEEMRSMDLFYIRNRTFLLDIRILYNTCLTLLSNKNY